MKTNETIDLNRRRYMIQTITALDKTVYFEVDYRALRNRNEGPGIREYGPWHTLRGPVDSVQVSEHGTYRWLFPTIEAARTGIQEHADAHGQYSAPAKKEPTARMLANAKKATDAFRSFIDANAEALRKIPYSSPALKSKNGEPTTLLDDAEWWAVNGGPKNHRRMLPYFEHWVAEGAR